MTYSVSKIDNNLKILLDNEYSWDSSESSRGKAFFKGLFWYQGIYYKGTQACNKLLNIFSLVFTDDSEFQDIIARFTGHYSFIVDIQDFIIACVDKVRSYPVYYSNKRKLLVSNSANMIKETLGDDKISETALLEFKMSGYTLGAKTLVKDISQLQPGEFLVFNKPLNRFNKYRYFRYLTNQYLVADEKELIEKLHAATLVTFKKMIESLDGKPVFLPLSGGLDSRLILAMLKNNNYDNIVSYTYGLKGVWEIKRAKYIAEKLKINWHYIQFKPHEVKKYFLTEDRQKYFRFAGGLNSAPHLAEYYALLELRKKNLIPDDAIIINGQSGDFTSGGHLPKILIETEKDKISIESFIRTIIDKHFSLWLDIKTEINMREIFREILKLLNVSDNKCFTKDEFAKYFELHEWEERQSKFVVNGQRAYDWLNYDWRLPFWSDELIEFWMKVDWKDKFGQALYIKYLKKHNFGGLFDNINLPPQFSYYPTWIKLTKPIFFIAGKLFNKKADYYDRKYLKYFKTYAPFYPQLKLSEFIKDSEWHRNSVSYFMKYYLNEFNNVNTLEM
ncbi:MAG: 7-cyano-7-deazaguanine synthase [Bacteroidetes bacterium]|nr:7-cyano-7-deazaguanine synthase [Bacteroidota bacterium]